MRLAKLFSKKSTRKRVLMLDDKGVAHVEAIGIKLLLMFVGAFVLGFVLGYEYALASGGNGCAE